MASAKLLLESEQKNLPLTPDPSSAASNILEALIPGYYSVSQFILGILGIDTSLFVFIALLLWPPSY